MAKSFKYPNSKIRFKKRGARNITSKTTNKLKDFLNKSKKMFHPPKELPNISATAQPSAQAQTPAVVQTTIQDTAQLTIKTQTPSFEIKKSIPKFEPPRSQEIIISPTLKSLPEVVFPKKEEERNFDDAIRNIHRDLMKNSESAQSISKPKNHTQDSKEEYYSPKELGEGYFSEIKHYINNKDYKEISEDIIQKDFLTAMKDYHDQKEQGKPYYLHFEDLQQKLESRMKDLMQKEQEWHELKRAIDESDRKKKHLEQDIDADAQELKELFKLIRVNSILQKPVLEGQQFILRSGPKLNNLSDLRKVLNYMSDEEFNHHVAEGKNDFASWAEVAIGLPLVANKMRAIKKKEELLEYLANPL